MWTCWFSWNIFLKVFSLSYKSALYKTKFNYCTNVNLYNRILMFPLTFANTCGDCTRIYEIWLPDLCKIQKHGLCVFNYMEIVAFTSSSVLMTRPYEAVVEVVCFATQCPGIDAQAPMATVYVLCRVEVEKLSSFHDHS